MKKTFILGAGASYPYGFPLGPTLKKEVISIINSSNHPYCRYLYSQFGLNPEVLSILASKIKESPVNSIDLFLSNHKSIPGMVHAGKMLIAFLINNREILDKLCAVENCWYTYLFNKILPLIKNDPSKLDELELYIITFNYDRSLERFLLQAIENSFDIKKGDAEKIVESFSEQHIIHIHGSLGNLSSFPYEFQGERLFSCYKDMAENIRIFHEQNETEIIEKITTILDRSKEIHFLGFGYLPENLEKLKFTKTGVKVYRRNIYGSRHNVTSNELLEINRICKSKCGYEINFFINNYPNDNFDCYNYLRNCVSFY